jgi:hypothetical protein
MWWNEDLPTHMEKHRNTSVPAHTQPAFPRLPLEQSHEVFCLCCILHCCMQPLLDQLVVEEGHSQAAQAAGRLGGIMTVKVLGKQLQAQKGSGKNSGSRNVSSIMTVKVLRKQLQK